MAPITRQRSVTSTGNHPSLDTSIDSNNNNSKPLLDHEDEDSDYVSEADDSLQGPTDLEEHLRQRGKATTPSTKATTPTKAPPSSLPPRTPTKSTATKKKTPRKQTLSSSHKQADRGLEEFVERELWARVENSGGLDEDTNIVDICNTNTTIFGKANTKERKDVYNRARFVKLQKTKKTPKEWYEYYVDPGILKSNSLKEGGYNRITLPASPPQSVAEPSPAVEQPSIIETINWEPPTLIRTQATPCQLFSPLSVGSVVR